MAKQQPAKETKQKEEITEVSSSDTLASFMVEHKGDHFNDIIPANRVISSGSLGVDMTDKVRSGSVVRISGLGAERTRTLRIACSVRLWQLL